MSIRELPTVSSAATWQTAFDEKELVDLFPADEAKEDDFDVEAELQKPAFSKAGDIWTLGRHTLVCGDSTDPSTYTSLMGGVKANLVITDPPYNVNYEGSAGKIKNDNMADEKFYEFLLAAFKNMASVLADDGSITLSPGEHSTLNFGEYPNAAAGSTLSQILQVGVPSKYYLSQKACLGILRRASVRGKELPRVLKLALMRQASTDTTAV